jgi:drug/metabolite transporter (DMT)-like permease
MSLRDFLILVAICLAWAVNTIISKLVVSTWNVPPLMYGALRFGIVMLATLPWLLPMPRPPLRIVIVGLLMGGGTFALLFIGLQHVTPSEAAVITGAAASGSHCRSQAC